MGHIAHCVYLSGLLCAYIQSVSCTALFLFVDSELRAYDCMYTMFGIRACMHAYIYVSMYIYIYLCIYVCVYVVLVCDFGANEYQVPHTKWK